MKTTVAALLGIICLACTEGAILASNPTTEEFLGINAAIAGFLAFATFAYPSSP